LGEAFGTKAKGRWVNRRGVKEAGMRPGAVRVPPHSAEAEQAVLGGLMLSQSALDRVVSVIEEADFYRKDHRLIFRAITDLDAKGQPYDAVTLGEWFDSNGIAELVGGSNYVMQLANNTPGAANIVAHAKIVRDKSLLRRLIDTGMEIAGDGFDPEGRSAQEILDATIVCLMAMQRVETQAEFTAKQAAKKAYDLMTEAHLNGGALNTIPTGLCDLDKLLGGFHPGDLIVIGARAAMGKTAMLTGFALHAATSGKPVGLISGEQPAEQIASRMMALNGDVEATKFRTGKFDEHEWPRVTSAFTTIAKAPIWILDRSSPSITEVQRVARRWKQQNKIEALYVDYLQRLEAPGERRWESVGFAVRGLKNLARDLNIPIIVLAQVSRQVETRKVPEPRMGDLSDSSEIEKEADQVLMIYRDEYYNEDSNEKGVAKIIIEKNRHGQTGYIKVAWIGRTMKFANLMHGYDAAD
jgi:replicative DNA helicase